MLKYKYYNNIDWEIHEIESTEFEYLLPQGSVLISDAEAAVILAPDAAEQAAIDEANRISDIENEALRLVQVRFPSIKNINEFKFYAEFWKSIAPSARQPTVDFQYAIDVYAVARSAIVGGAFIGDVIWP